MRARFLLFSFLLAISFSDSHSSQELQRKKRHIFECKAEGSKCKMYDHCCANLDCYRPDGYSLFASGSCVQCIPIGQHCQRDAQCCKRSVEREIGCVRQTVSVDGVCDYTSNDCVPKAGRCWKSSQCCQRGSDRRIACHKDSFYSVNGICDYARDQGEQCHRNSQCLSNDCDHKWSLSGKCTRPRK